LGQFGLLEVALEAMGVVVWPMVELEADDALASAAAVAADDPSVAQVVICTPDKDLGQCVRDGRVVQLDRRRQLGYDEAGVKAKFGGGPGRGPRRSTTPPHWSASPPRGGSGRWPSATAQPWPPPYATCGPRPCCSRTWPPCGSTAPCWRPPPDCAGPDPARC